MSKSLLIYIDNYSANCIVSERNILNIVCAMLADRVSRFAFGHLYDTNKTFSFTVGTCGNFNFVSRKI